MGRPKALVADEHGSWLVRAVAALRDGGCDEVRVVLGADADRAAALVPGVPVVLAESWPAGMGESLRAGLAAVAATGADAAVVTLVDLPDVGPEVVRRVLARTRPGPGTLARAAYSGRPGHPAVLGREHLAAVLASAAGERGARDYFAAHAHQLVECGDLASGRDRDGPLPG